VLAKPALNDFSHALAHFLPLLIFLVKSFDFLPGTASDHYFPTWSPTYLVSQAYTTIPSLLVEMGVLTNFLPRQDLNSDPSNLCLLIGWDYR
jgi:hypothetical protein